MVTETTDRAWFSQFLRHQARKQSRSIFMTPEPVRFRSILLYDNSASFTSSRTEDVRQNLTEWKVNLIFRRDANSLTT